MLTLCGLSLLYQGLDLKQEGKLMQDGQRMVTVVIKYLGKANAPGAADFKRLAASMMNLEQQPKATNGLINGRIGESVTKAFSSLRATPSPPIPRKQLQPQLYRHASASMSESDLLLQQAKLRRATLPSIPILSAADALQRYGRNSTESTRSEESPRIKREYRTSTTPQVPAMVRNNTKNLIPPNLDYLSLNNTPVASQPPSPAQTRTHHPQSHTPIFPTPTSAYNSQKATTATATPSEWEVLLGTFDDRHLYDAIYGGAPSGPTPAISVPDNASSNFGSWSPDSWDYTVGMGDFTNNAGPNSVLSFSEDSLSSGDDLSGSDLLLPAASHHDYKPGLMTANLSNDGYDYLLSGLDSAFGL